MNNTATSATGTSRHHEASRRRLFFRSVQALSPELYDEILDLTLIIEEVEVKVDDDYLPPVQLQIDRASRKAVSAKYYAGTTFTFAFIPYYHALVLFGPWLTSIGDNRRLIKTIHLDKRNYVQKMGFDSQLANGDLDLDLNKLYDHLVLQRHIWDVKWNDVFHIPITKEEESEEMLWMSWKQINDDMSHW